MKDEEKNKTVRSYEIDFLLSRKDKICPIEVKSSGYNSHKSLDKFQQNFRREFFTGIFSIPKIQRKTRIFLLAHIYDGIIIKHYQSKVVKEQDSLILKDR